MPRPRIAVPGRIAERTSAHRQEGIAISQRLLELIWAAGGEPLVMLPLGDRDWTGRLEGVDGVLLPGGGDVDPSLYGQQPQSDELYGINRLQDDADISLLKYVFAHDLPLLTICRGTQVANVALGGTLIQHMDAPHRDRLAQIALGDEFASFGINAKSVTGSCFHHQSLNRLGDGVAVIARDADSTIEAVSYKNLTWGLGVQWHPEDNYKEDSAQLEIVEAFINAAKK